MVYIKNLALLSFLLVVLAGCGHIGGWFGWTSLFSSTDTADDFVTDNDSVFDLFQDDFGTGDQYDDRFISDDDTATDTDIPTDTSPPPPPVSTTKDPAYDEIAKMTPDELRALGILTIPMLLHSGNEFPFPDKQFGAIKGADICDHPHYHGASGYSIDLVDVPEPSSECGFDNKVTQRTVTGQQMVDWFLERPRNF